MILLVGIALANFVVPDGWELPVVVGGVILEVVETVVALRVSRRGKPRVGPETLIGATGRAVTPCQPSGRVRVRGEEWQARCPAGIQADQRVRVLGREGLTLLVEPTDS